MDTPEYSLAEVADLLGMSEAHVREMCPKTKHRVPFSYGDVSGIIVIPREPRPRPAPRERPQRPGREQRSIFQRPDPPPSPPPEMLPPEPLADGHFAVIWRSGRWEELGVPAFQWGCTYFIAEAEDWESPIKIGRADYVEDRLADLQCGSPRLLDVRGVAPGAGFEALLHAHFIQSRLHGEWFRATPELHAVVALFSSGYVSHKDMRHNERLQGRLRMHPGNRTSRLWSGSVGERPRPVSWGSTRAEVIYKLRQYHTSAPHESGKAD